MKIENRDTLALLARKIPVEMHAHHAVQLVVSLNESYPANLGGEEFAAVRGFLIDRDVPHACRSENADLLVTSVDAETDKGRCLRRILGGKKFRLIEDVMPVKTIEDFAVSFREESRFRSFRAFSEARRKRRRSSSEIRFANRSGDSIYRRKYRNGFQDFRHRRVSSSVGKPSAAFVSRARRHLDFVLRFVDADEAGAARNARRQSEFGGRGARGGLFRPRAFYPQFSPHVRRAALFARQIHRSSRSFRFIKNRFI